MKKFFQNVFCSEGLEGVFRRIIIPRITKLIRQTKQSCIKTFRRLAPLPDQIWNLWKWSVLGIKWLFFLIFVVFSVLATIYFGLILLVAPIIFLIQGSRSIAKIKAIITDEDSVFVWNLPKWYAWEKSEITLPMCCIWAGLIMLIFGIAPTILPVWLKLTLVASGVLSFYLGFKQSPDFQQQTTT